MALPFWTIPASRALQDAPEEWEGGARAAGDWLAWLGTLGAWAFLALFAFLVLRGIATRRRYRAQDALPEPDRKALQGAIEAAEQRTRGEIFVVVLGRSDRHPAADWIAGLFTLVLGSALLAPWLPWDRPALLVFSQLGLGLVGFLAARALPGFKRRFVSAERATEMAEEQALQEFFAHGLHETVGRTGVLLFVSLLEHRVVVLGDRGIDEEVPPEHWRETDEAILAGLRAGSLRGGLEEGIARCGRVLEEHFPLEGEDRDELPDHVVVRDE